MQHRYKRSNILVGWSIHTAHANIQNFDVCEMFCAQCLQCLRQTVGCASKVWGVLSPTPCHYFIPTTPVTCSTSSLMVVGEACDTPIDQESLFYTHKYFWPDPSDPLWSSREVHVMVHWKCAYRLNQEFMPTTSVTCSTWTVTWPCMGPCTELLVRAWDVLSQKTW